jgi:hypothetical protein
LIEPAIAFLALVDVDHVGFLFSSRDLRLRKVQKRGYETRAYH